MANSTFASGSSDGTVEFDRPVYHILMNINTSASKFLFSIDLGNNYMELPTSQGFFSFPVGSVTEVRIQADNEWQLIGLHA